MNDIGPDDMDDTHISVGNVDSAILELQNLIRHLPITTEEAAARLDELTPDVPDILKVYADEIRSRLEDEIRYKFEYGLADYLVERNSDYENDFYRLITRLETYREITSFQKILEKIEMRLSRIDEMRPSGYFDFRTACEELDEDFLPGNVVEHIHKAITAFDEERFGESISNCGHATKAIVNRFCNLLEIECGGQSLFNRMDTIKQHLEGGSRPKMRLEWYTLFLISVVYWLRNAEAHKEDSEPRMPPWMNVDRKKQITWVENAHTALVCTLQAAKELQKLIEMSGYFESTI